MTLKEWFRKKVLSRIGLVKEQSPNSEEEKISLINNRESIIKSKLKEYRIWYGGDGDELLNFYTKGNMIDFNYEPFYMRNKKSYFWSVASTESDIKRTHSGQPRNIVDTLVNIMKFPTIKALPIEGLDNNIVNDNLKAIIKDSRLKTIYKDHQMPMTLVEGWGCYKINWDKDVSDYPYIVYYRAEDVDFIYKSNRIIGVVFRDYYTNEKKEKYLLTETRSLKFDREKEERVLVIEKELFLEKGGTGGVDEDLVKVDFSTVPELDDGNNYIEIGPVNFLFAIPCIFFEADKDMSCGYGRSIFTGKIDLFDDLDESLSQASNTVRRSTAMEYFNSDFLERDPRTGLPRQPKAYDRKYTIYQGQKDSDGGSTSQTPVQVTQPDVNFTQYDSHSIQILIQIINGLMSPATLGIDIAKKDNAEAQREKEKVTIFTRNAITETESEILKDLCSQLLCAYEFMNTGKITCHEYSVSVKYSEFADDSFENKLKELSIAYDSEAISDEMYVEKLYGDSLTETERNNELEWLRVHHTQPRTDGMLGIRGGGENDEGLF